VDYAIERDEIWIVAIVPSWYRPSRAELDALLRGG
jgi:hypothetical protein